MKVTTSSELVRVESLLLEHFKKEPFHNLHLIYGKRLSSKPPGGTCSDKTLSFIADATQQGFNVALHSGFIGGLEIHRLASVKIGKQRYFADVGNGWPSLHLYPVDRPISYRCFGMRFRSEIDDQKVSIFHEKHGKESLQMEIPLVSKSEADIMTAISQRFSTGIQYPFSNSLRYSSVRAERFLFLRGDRLEIYSDDGFEVIEGIGDGQVASALLEYFGYDLEPILVGEPYKDHYGYAREDESN